MPPTSLGKAPTRWTPSPEMDGPNSTMMVRSTAKSASILATNQPSKLANGDFFSSLLKAFPVPMEEAVGVAVNGKLYIIQGLTDGGFQPMGVVYVYDPQSNEWSKKKDMPQQVHHAMTAVHNGKIYVFGGFARPGKELAWQPVDNAWEYTPETDSWKALAPLPTRRGAAALRRSPPHDRFGPPKQT